MSSSPPPWHSLVILLSFPACAALGVAACQLYLGIPFDPLPMLSMAVVAFAIYAFNRFTDVAEDQTNDPTRASSRLLVGVLLALAIAALVGVGVRLAAIGRAPLLYFAVILAIGAAYSLPIVPYYRDRVGWSWVRFKDLLLLKNVVVAAVWTSAFFVAPVLHAPTGLRVSPSFGVMAAGFFLAYLANVVFCDFRDEKGDRQANVDTLPVRFGVRTCYATIAALGALWLGAVVGLWLRGSLPGSHVVSLIVMNGLYPACVWFVRESRRAGVMVVDYVVESIIPLFALCMALLHRA